MLSAISPLVRHQISLPVLQNLKQETWHTWFICQRSHGCEQSFEVEDYGAREREAAEGLPVYAKVDLIDFVCRVLGGVAVGEVRIVLTFQIKSVVMLFEILQNRSAVVLLFFFFGQAEPL
jgi:hypothetical protein